MITVNSPIVGKGGSVNEALSYLTTSTSIEQEYVKELWRLCSLVWLDFRVAFAQWAHETADGTSPRWIANRNPSGLGVESDSDPDPATFSGIEAARIHVWSLLVATDAANEFFAMMPPAPYGPKTTFYSRWVDKFGDPNCPTTITVADLGRRYTDASGEPQATWGWDAAYAKKIVARANVIFTEETPVTNIVLGRVPKPPIIDLICPKPFEGAGFYRVPPRQNVGVCEHITDGRGSVEFYHAFFSTGGERATDALVDFVIGRDGRIAMLNDWRGTRAPWANGNKLGMEGDGPAYYQRFGVEGIDRRLVSIEHEGHATEDWPAAMWNAAVALDAWLFDQMGVRHDSFPVHQDYGVVTHLLHSEFTNKGGNALDECPGRYLKQHITAFQNDVRAVMMAHQVVSGEPEPPVKPPIDITPKPFAGFAHGLATGTDQHDGDDLYEVVRREFKVAPGRKAQRRVSVGKDALIVAVLPEGAKVKGAFLTRQDGIDWLIDADGYAYQANAFNPKFTLPLRAKQQPKAA